MHFRGPQALDDVYEVLISMGSLSDDLVVNPRLADGNRWRPWQSCLAAYWPWYITVSTASSSSAICLCSPAQRTSSISSATFPDQDHQQRSPASADQGLPPLGGSLCQEAQTSPGVGRERVRTQDYVRPYLRRMQRRHQFGVYFILKSMELGPSFRSAIPRFPVKDPPYCILARQGSRYTHHLLLPSRPVAAVTDRFAQFKAQALDVHVDFPLVQRVALPIPSESSKIPGI